MTPENLPYAVNRHRASGVELEVAVVGEPGQPTCILLHGFPDLWQGWHFQIPALREAGFRVLIPNQRGYGKSDKPKQLAAYDIEHLANDVIALANAENCKTFHLVGHDWGGVVAWWVAARFPERVSQLVILNAPHPGIFQKYLLRSPTQLLRSWYVGVFQIPWLPEMILSARNYEVLFRAVNGTSQPGIFDESDRRYLVAGWSEPGSLTSMLNYYRAASRRSSKSMQLRVSVPTRILFSKHDPAEEPGLADASLSMCDQGRIVWFDAKHWIQREEADRVTAEILDVVTQPSH